MMTDGAPAVRRPPEPTIPGVVRAAAHRPRSRTGALLLVALAVVGGFWLLAAAIPSLNPFGSETVDRSQPAVLKSIEKLSQYRAASANLQVIVDVEEDANLLPSFLKGERTLFVAAGRVDAAVDFGRLRGRNVQVSADRRSVTLALPSPTLTEPQLDLDRSRVYDRDRGLLDRIESVFEDSPTADQPLFELAQQKLLEAARADASLTKAAQDNTRSMLTGLLRGLGFERVTVRFEQPPT